MSEKNETPTGYIKKETMLTVVLIALGVGFLGGATLSSFKFESGDSTPAQATQQQAAQQQAVQEGGITSDVAGKISALEMETSLNPKNVEAWTQLGNFYFDTDQVEEAIEAYKKSLELEPNNPNVLTDLGIMYRRSRQTILTRSGFASTETTSAILSQLSKLKVSLCANGHLAKPVTALDFINSLYTNMTSVSRVASG